ncbi:MAG: 2-oxo acid dehydrogenase subunit E2 [Armatimonadetes bacterium]|nr:2-oxo acid dehydrogenase subunit E2 [Armatimonadota bacterium]MDE2205498.1 2-oxo acid dehydrogenase subunit E2 [Armatimonadota bacterium]
MPTQEILVPQMGEGLQEVRILSFAKNPGDMIRRDELIYSMETDKATMDVESPFSGTLRRWLVSEGDIVPIGAPIAEVEVAAATASSAAQPAPAAPPADAAAVPPAAARPVLRVAPRTRQHCKTLGVSEEEMALIPSLSGTLMPEDVDRYLALRAPAEGQSSSEYTDHTLSQQQRLLIYHFKRSAQTIVPGTIRRVVEWGLVKSRVGQIKRDQPELHVSEFQSFAWVVAQVSNQHPKFRSILVGEQTLREYNNLNMGVAVSLPEGNLTTAVIRAANQLPYPEFVKTLQQRIRAARDGADQADAATQLLLTYMGGYGVIDAVPVLVAPAIAVLFIGAAFEQEGKTLANTVLTFDHRVVNGVQAAEFLQAVGQAAEEFGRDGVAAS